MPIIVPSQLPLAVPSRLAFVTDAPTIEDSIAGRPLSGADGAVFGMMMRSANLDRDEFYVGSIFNEVPPEDDREKADWIKDEGRLNENFARLAEELQASGAATIVPLGSLALWGFTNQTLIAKFRGAVTQAERIVPGAKLVPTYAPSAIRKSWNLLTLTINDLIKADREALKGPEIVYPKMQLLIEPTVADVREFAAECHAAEKLGVDIETGWGQITAISFAPTPTRAMSIPFVDLRKPNKSYWLTAEEEFEVWRIVLNVLRNPVPKTGQNFMYDLFWLYEKRGAYIRNYRSDTRLRHKVLYPELPADLATMSATYTDVGSYKVWGGKYQKEIKKDG